jgi:hypothetical protein
MLTPASISAISSDIPSPIWEQISQFARAFQLELAKRDAPAPLRLRYPRDEAIFLDPNNVYFVIDGGPSKQHVSRNGRDLRNTGPVQLESLIASIERELSWVAPFGFAVSFTTIQNPSEDEVRAIVDKYVGFEVQEFEKRQREVRLNPIFQGRKFMLDETLCFVLMPFSAEHQLQEIYADTVKPTILAAGLRCVRADDIYDTTLIIETIWENINRARLLVVELTGRNPNVFYELGIAHSVGKEAILLSQSIDDVPFDLRHLRCIIYSATPRGVDTMKKQLQAAISSVLRKPTR